MIGRQKIRLTEEDFRKLTKGKVLEFSGTMIVLEDIGFDRMLMIIAQNYDDLQESRRMNDEKK